MVVGGMAMLEEVARAGDINGLYALLRQCHEKLLEEIDQEPFIDTPLHIAASAGHTHFALEILRLKPSFGKKLNPDALSPLHLALRNGTKDTVKRLIEYDPELIRVQGREGFTSLHYLVANESDEDIDLLAEFLIKCPASIRYTTIRGETALHLAVANRKVEAFKVLSGWLRRTDDYKDGVLNWKDENGNAALHLAVSTNQPEILKKLLSIRTILFNKNEKNLEGETMLDIAKRFPPEENQEIRKILKRVRAAESSSIPKPETLAAYLSSTWNIFQEMILKCDVYLEKGLSNDMRNALLVVAVLIATATYQAILQPPGGISQGDQNPSLILNGTYINGTTIHNATITSIDHRSTQAGNGAGKIVIPEKDFYPFFIVNSAAFAASLGIIFALLPGYFGSLLLYLPLGFMFASYVSSGYFISPASPIRSIVLAVPSMLFFLIVWSKLWFLNSNRVLAYKKKQLRRSVYVCKYSEQQ